MSKKIYLLAISSLFYSYALCMDGDLDASFGTGGIELSTVIELG